MKFIKLSVIVALIASFLLPVFAAESRTTVPTEPTISTTEATTPPEVVETTAASAEPIAETPPEKTLIWDAASISLILTSITAIAAIIAPVISTVYTIRNNRRLKEMDLRLPRTYEAFNNLFEAYDSLSRDDPNSGAYPSIDYHWVPEHFQKFIIAFHKLLPLIPDISLHDRALALIKDIAANHGYVSKDTDKVFFGIVADMSRCITQKDTLFSRLAEKIVLKQPTSGGK